jgi:DNA-binding NarL/FixJ family response regulator
VWRWDERRRFLAAHPEIVRRLEAKRVLRQERKELRRAVAVHDAEKFIQHSVAALRVAVAPHFPANAPALVGADVLSQLDAPARAGREGAVVRAVFAAADNRFAALPAGAKDLLALKADVEVLLDQLEEKL